VRRVLDASIESFAPAVSAAGVHLSLEAPAEIMVDADAFRLRQVFDNLLSNAVKYSRADDRVSITAHADMSAVRVDIADTGIGIDSSELPRIFEPYYRAQSARDSGVIGNGIGMGVVREIVEEHGGAIDVASALGRGTMVQVTLPRHISGGRN
jgi:signal transduction histidine kinase